MEEWGLLLITVSSVPFLLSSFLFFIFMLRLVLFLCALFSGRFVVGAGAIFYTNCWPAARYKGRTCPREKRAQQATVFKVEGHTYVCTCVCMYVSMKYFRI